MATREKPRLPLTSVHLPAGHDLPQRLLSARNGPDTDKPQTSVSKPEATSFMLLLITNSAVGFREEHAADSAIVALKATLAAVNVANARHAKHTSSHSWISTIGALACFAALAALVWQTAQTAPAKLWVLAAMIGLAVVIEGAYRVLKRQVRWCV